MEQHACLHYELVDWLPRGVVCGTKIDIGGHLRSILGVWSRVCVRDGGDY